MSEDQTTRITVGGHSTGIIGLKAILEQVANELAGATDDDIKAELIKRLAPKNYISNNAKEVYGQAFLREYKKFSGEPFEDKDSDGLEIKVLGPGCARCNKLEQECIAMASELNLVADIEHITDMLQIASYGVMGTPALIINGKVMAVGSVPPKNKLKEWLLEAAKPST